MSTQATSIKCYIEEYEDESGNLAARLREKHTGHKVDLGFVDPAEKRHFIEFLSAVKRNEVAMPDAFTKNGNDDWIAVSGDVDFDAPDEIRFIHNERLQYIVE